MPSRNKTPVQRPLVTRKSIPSQTLPFRAPPGLTTPVFTKQCLTKPLLTRPWSFLETALSDELSDLQTDPRGERQLLRPQDLLRLFHLIVVQPKVCAFHSDRI